MTRKRGGAAMLHPKICATSAEKPGMMVPRTSSVRSPVRGSAANSSAVIRRCWGKADMAHLPPSSIPHFLCALAHHLITIAYLWDRVSCWCYSSVYKCTAVEHVQQGADIDDESSERVGTVA